MSELANNFKSKFAGLLRGLLRKVDNDENSEPKPVHPVPAAFTHQPTATPVESFAAPPPPAYVAAPPPAPVATANMSELEMPLLPIIERLPADLRAKSMTGGVNLSQASIAIAVEKVLPQLALGTVKITFGELRNAAPSLFRMGEEYDSLPIVLPLNEVLARLHPGLIARSPVQRSMDAPPADISSPFGADARGVSFANTLLKPGLGTTSPATTHFLRKTPPPEPIKMPMATPVAPPPPAFTQRPSAPVPPVTPALPSQPLVPPPVTFTPRMPAPTPAVPVNPVAPVNPVESIPPIFTPRTPASQPPTPAMPINPIGSAPPTFTPRPPSPPPAVPPNRLESIPPIFSRSSGAVPPSNPVVPNNSVPPQTTFTPRTPANPFPPINPIAPVPPRTNGPTNGNGSNGSNGTSQPIQVPPTPRVPIPPIPFPKPPTAAPAVPAAPAIPVASAVPTAPTDAQTIFAPLSALMEAWPEPLRQEIVQLNLIRAELAMPVYSVEPALKRGRVIFPWHHLRSWIRPTPPGPSIHDAMEVELPLKVLAPLFMPKKKADNKPHSRADLPPSSVPNLFFGFPQPQPEEMAPPVNAPSAPAPLPPLKTVDAKLSETNYYQWGDGGDAPKMDETDYKRPAPATDFSSRRATPGEIIERAMRLPGVVGAIVALPDGLKVAHQLPADLNADTVAAFLPQLFSRVSQCSKELRMGELNNLNFTLGSTPWKIFRVNAVYFAAFGHAGEPLPTAQLASLAGELDRKTN